MPGLWAQVGDWTPQDKVTFMSNYTKAMTEGYRQTLKNKTLTIVTIKVCLHFCANNLFIDSFVI